MFGISILTHTLKSIIYIGMPGIQKVQGPQKIASSYDSKMPKGIHTGNANDLGMKWHTYSK